ncbi:substrate-binding domain-containing protein [Achromobacter sp. UMC46]|uniref:substrate-binding domain-containing protein n=1 Tax=Achromobacter sp. UMC46 TaxID=1862319 RepID=UPI0015FF0E2C|nr:substrate-binding domain-containing protein [Achromobacter sp. UMC46]MBB1596099.1 ABC transporter substrate-binding protein [Achromobacter sp. UMC46]
MKSFRTFAGGMLAMACLAAAPAWAAQDLNVYGPGGPAPAMKEAAAAFGKTHGITVNVTAGPTPAWADKAKQDADVLFSGAENMMSGFASALPGVFDLRDARTLYLRPSAILVRPGNPKGISGFKDLLKPGIKVMAVSGAGQTGLWEDVAGRLGDIGTVRAFRANLVLPEAANSAMARTQWTEDKSIDAWLIWNIWQVSNPTLASVVDIEEPYRIYRDAGAVVTRQGKGNPQAQAFVDYLASADGKAIFKKWGWKTD